MKNYKNEFKWSAFKCLVIYKRINKTIGAFWFDLILNKYKNYPELLQFRANFRNAIKKDTPNYVRNRQSNQEIT